MIARSWRVGFLFCGLVACSDDGVVAPKDAAPEIGAQDAAPVLHPQLGVNYTHVHAALSGNGLLFTYQNSGVRALAQSQLAAMYANGARTTRLIVWHEDAIGTNDWGVIPTALPEPYRTNFVNYLTDLTAAGFTRLTIAFGPAGANDPKENYGATCDCTFSLLEQNWAFIQQIRTIAKQYGPPDVRFDLLNEGAPYDWLDGNCTSGKSVKAQVRAYDTQIIDRWMKAYGNSDVTLSVMAGALLTCDVDGGTTFDNTVLVGELGELLGVFGQTLPGWFAVHAYYPGDPKCAPILGQSVLASLMTVDSFLASKQITQPIVIQETYYNDVGVASAVQKLMQTSPRPIDELMEWPLTAGSTQANIDVDPPYSLSNYLGLPK